MKGILQKFLIVSDLSVFVRTSLIYYHFRLFPFRIPLQRFRIVGRWPTTTKGRPEEDTQRKMNMISYGWYFKLFDKLAPRLPNYL